MDTSIPDSLPTRRAALLTGAGVAADAVLTHRASTMQAPSAPTALGHQDHDAAVVVHYRVRDL